MSRARRHALPSPEGKSIGLILGLYFGIQTGAVVLLGGAAYALQALGQ